MCVRARVFATRPTKFACWCCPMVETFGRLFVLGWTMFPVRVQQRMVPFPLQNVMSTDRDVAFGMSLLLHITEYKQGDIEAPLAASSNRVIDTSRCRYICTH